MIAKTLKRKSARSLFDYHMHGNRSEIIGGNMAGTTPRELAAEAGQFRKLRPNLDRALVHLVLSAAPDDPVMDNQRWSEIADRFCHDLSFDECARIYFRHDDTDNQHIHIVGLRIDKHGKTVSESNDQYKAERSLARIEVDYGLRRVNQVKKRKVNAKPIQDGGKQHESQQQQPEEVTMQDQKPAAESASMPESLNVGTDLAQQAFSIDHVATVMMAVAGDGLNKRKRREIRRAIRADNYDDLVRQLLHPDVTNIYHHDRGSVIYLRRPERLNDDGDKLTAYNMDHTKAARVMLALASSRGWTSIIFSGPHDFIVAAMREAIAQGMPVHPRDAAQKAILDMIRAESAGAVGTVAIPMAFQPPPERLQVNDPLELGNAPTKLTPIEDAPAIPPHNDMASKLAQRRKRKPTDQSHSNGPKGP